MRYLELKNQLEPFTVFSLTDVRKLDPNFHRTRLSEWQDKGYIKKILRKYYLFADTPTNDQVLYLVSGTIYHPSYVSLESALSHYHIIPEAVYRTTAISTNKTTSLDTILGRFDYKNLKPELFFGYQVHHYHNQPYKLAEIEKTILDYLHLNPDIDSVDKISELRWNKEELTQQLNQDKLNDYTKKFQNKSLSKRLKSLITYLTTEES